MSNRKRKKRILIPLSVLLLLTISVSFIPQVNRWAYRQFLNLALKHSVPEVSVDQVAVHNNIVLLDARQPQEYAVSHIAHALHVGYPEIDSSLAAGLDKDTPIVVYCSIGYRSEKVAELLCKQGFTNVSNLYGGIFEWVNQGQPVVDSLGTTNKVHAYSRLWGFFLREGEKVYH